MENWTKPSKDTIPPHIRAWQEETGNVGRGGYYQMEDPPMYVDVCYFFEGRHYPGELCPHRTTE